jgi:hypothetical protein
MTTKRKDKKEKATRSPFLPTYPVSLSTHMEFGEDDRPVFTFRAATIKERNLESPAYDRIFNIEEEDAETVSSESMANDLIPLIENRLVSVTESGKPCESIKGPDDLDVSSIIELFVSMCDAEIPSIAEKKRSLWLSSFVSDESAEDAESATEQSTSSKESPSSNVLDATETDAGTVIERDGSN